MRVEKPAVYLWEYIISYFSFLFSSKSWIVTGIGRKSVKLITLYGSVKQKNDFKVGCYFYSEKLRSCILFWAWKSEN